MLMKSMIKKKILLALIGASAALSALSLNYAIADNTTAQVDDQQQLFIPPLIDSRQQHGTIELTIQNTQHEFFPGVKSDTKGYNQSYLGPTIRLYKGENTKLILNNQLAEPTTMHGHGLHVDGRVDGGPQDMIAADSKKVVVLPIVQEAGTSWYHPHIMGTTAEQVHAGLAGMYIIEDKNSLSLPLPKTYGVDDIPLVVQDRSFINKKMVPYSANMHDVMLGLREDTLVVNGTIDPVKSVPAGWVRLRLLNGSNARFYRFHFSNNALFYKIATDGGFLNKPVAMHDLVMAPGERNEVMINLADIKSIKLLVDLLPPFASVTNAGLVWPSSAQLPQQSVVTLRTDKTLPATGQLPPILNNIPFYTQAEQASANPRSFFLGMGHHNMMGGMMGGMMGNSSANNNSGSNNSSNNMMNSMFTINGQSMNMNVINQKVKKGQLEIWTVAANMMPHPFHVHGTSFQILSQNGQPVAEADKGWKDTVIVSNQPTQLLVRFDQTASKEYPYMYHCHILEHEDAGMMGQFTVE